MFQTGKKNFVNKLYIAILFDTIGLWADCPEGMFEMKFDVQFGVVGVGYGGGKAHFVVVRAGEVVYRYGREERKYFDANVNCGSQKWSAYGRSAINGFEPVGQAYEAEGEVPKFALESEEWFQERQAFYEARHKVEVAHFEEAFEAAVEQYGENFCAKCKKQGEAHVAWAKKKKEGN